MKILSSNQELYQYLLSLESLLKQRGTSELSKAAIKRAIGNAASSSTEFLGESQIALIQVLHQEKSILTNQERSELVDVLKQLDEAFKSH